MIQSALLRNRRIYKVYNNFRKQIFREIAPKDSEDILYLLPWLLSINHPACPGYIPTLQKPFWVYGIDREKEIWEREQIFKTRFRVQKKSTLLKHTSIHLMIQGVYTIGSVGTINQTSSSDCDIWICYDKSEFSQKDWISLNQKINLVKDWMDIQLRIPVFFFITDISDIRNNVFGCVNEESSGSAQKSVLKEEFYRTTILICGKIPLWWICWDQDEKIPYNEAALWIANDIEGNYDLIDMGDLKQIDTDEYFGAALWQLHKSLTHPLKSLVKMFFLRMLLDSQGRKLACSQFRTQVFQSGYDTFPDPGAFLIHKIFRYNRSIRKDTEIEFLKECFYLRCQIKPYERNDSIKKRLAKELFTEHHLDMKRRIELSQYDQWDFKSQIELGNHLFTMILTLYREIEGVYAAHKSRIDKKDLTILGRKIAVFYSKKKYKISILHKPDYPLNLTGIKLKLENKEWVTSFEDGENVTLILNTELIHNIAFLVWNNLFVSTRLSMEPNASPVSIQEIINLGHKMKEIFGSYETVVNELTDFLKDEYIRKILVVISFEKSPWEKDINDFHIIYQNSWGELFVRHFQSPHSLKAFLNQNRIQSNHTEIRYYLQRNATYYEKIIDRTRNFFILI
jgi:adenylate cyclase, class 1